MIFQVIPSGVLIRSNSATGTIMTKCLLKKEFFKENSFHLDIRKPSMKKLNLADKSHNMLTIVELCLPFLELKQIVDGMVEDDNHLEIEYPRDDNFLELVIPEELKGGTEKHSQRTTVRLETY